MAIQYSTAVRDAQNDALETATGASPTLEIRSGVQPANCAAAAAGTLLASGVLPADWLTASASGLKAKNGVWTATGQAGAGAGTAGGHFRIIQGATCHMHGSFGAASDMVPDNNNIATGQVVTITAFNLTRNNA
jgi:hypothetical protein